jgi:hypothetical protein
VRITARKIDKEPGWRTNGRELTTGYRKPW